MHSSSDASVENRSIFTDLRCGDRGWLANFYVSGLAHSATSDASSAWEPTPWRAVQMAAWEALTKRAEAPPAPAEDIILP